ncbi:MAG TPA: elongation factor P [Treponemataceae bacterium]|nr:elongation factor P [Treponemataceae bacterium]
MLAASQLKVGVAFMQGAEPWIVQRMLGNKTGRGSMVYRLRIKNIVTGQTMDVGFDSSEKFNEVDLVLHKVKLSYIDGDTYVFMEEETYEQFEINKEDLGDNVSYIAAGDEFICELTFFNDKPVGVELPIQVVREITYCEPGVKGDTSGKATKTATLDTGFEVQVPLFCDIGTKIMLDTRDGTFIERAK